MSGRCSCFLENWIAFYQSSVWSSLPVRRVSVWVAHFQPAGCPNLVTSVIYSWSSPFYCYSACGFITFAVHSFCGHFCVPLDEPSSSFSHLQVLSKARLPQLIFIKCQILSIHRKWGTTGYVAMWWHKYYNFYTLLFPSVLVVAVLLTFYLYKDILNYTTLQVEYLRKKKGPPRVNCSYSPQRISSLDFPYYS